MAVKKAKPVEYYFNAAERYLWLRGIRAPTKKQIREEAVVVRKQLISMGFARE